MVKLSKFIGDFILRQCFRAWYALFNDILRSKNGFVAEKLLKFDIQLLLSAPNRHWQLISQNIIKDNILFQAILNKHVNPKTTN